MSDTAEKKQIVVEDIQDMLKAGKTRKDIAEHYDLPITWMAENVFNHPDLKGLKTKKTYDVVVVKRSDVQGTGELQAAPEAQTEEVAEEVAHTPAADFAPATDFEDR